MDRVSEQISKANASSQGRTDANLANDSNHLGGIPAEDYATKKYVQDYHDGKESDLKGYIDRQDQSVLEEAKEYTNSQIRNQDFSGFAKVTDVQALDKKLSGELEEGLTAQKNYTDQKTNQIVADVNANFDDVNGAISKLNGNMDNLFQSVSSGKSQIAGAITDKGVTTSASDSFSTMATNIRAIQSGGGEIDPNFVNTSDGNATENDIRLGKIAYAKGQKIYGSLVAGDTDTDDATATANDIRSGKTAYVKGQKIYGNLEISKESEYEINPDNPYPEKAEVELVYGEKEGEIEMKTIPHIQISPYNLYDISSDKRLLIYYDEEDGKIKSLFKGINQFGEEAYVKKVNELGQTVSPEYTFEDLGITGVESYELCRIKFSIMNDNEERSGYECIVAFLFVKTIETVEAESAYKAFLYRVKTTDGKMTSENEKHTVTSQGSTYDMVFFNRWIICSEAKNTLAYLEGYTYMIWSPFSKKLGIVTEGGTTRGAYSAKKLYEISDSIFDTDTENYEAAITEEDFVRYRSGDYSLQNVYFRANDRIVLCVYTRSQNANVYFNNSVQIRNENFTLIDTTGYTTNDPAPVDFTNDGLYMTANNGNIYSSIINYDTGEIEFNLYYEGILASDLSNEIRKAYFSRDNKFLIVQNRYRSYLLSVDFVNNKYTKLYEWDYGYLTIKNMSDFRTFEIPDDKLFIETIIDGQVLIGLKYDGKMFYNNIFNAGRYTAKQEDVLKGKTFIGFKGMPETGTMEV